MSIPLHVLILEDQPADSELALHALRRAGFAPVWRRVETEPEYLAALDPSLDLILADYALPQFDALHALELLRARKLDIPFIIVSGTIGEDRAVAAIQRGATDYLIKDRLARLGAAVENALQQRRLQAEKLRADQLLDASEQRFRALIEHSSDGIALVGATGIIYYASPSTSRILGYAPETLAGRDGFALIHPEDQADIRARLAALPEQPGESATAHGRVRHADGGWRWIELVANNMLAEPGVGTVVLNYRDITERIQAEQALRAAEAKYRMLIEHIPAIVYQAALDETSSTLYVNEQVEKILGFSQAEWMADSQRWLKQLYPRDLGQVLADMSRVHANRRASAARAADSAARRPGHRAGRRFPRAGRGRPRASAAIRDHRQSSCPADRRCGYSHHPHRRSAVDAGHGDRAPPTGWHSLYACSVSRRLPRT